MPLSRVHARPCLYICMHCDLMNSFLREQIPERHTQLTVHSSASLLFSPHIPFSLFLFSSLFSSSPLPLPLSSDLFTFLVALRLTFVRQPSSCSFFLRCCRIRVRGLINMSCIRAHLPAAATAVAVAATAHHRHHRRARRAAPYLKLAPRRASGLAGEREAMCTRRLHRSILSFSFILAPSRRLSRALPLLLYFASSLSLSLSYHFFLASSLLPLSAAPSPWTLLIFLFFVPSLLLFLSVRPPTACPQD